MCGRYELSATAAELQAQFGTLLPQAQWGGFAAVQRYNVAPGQRCAAVRYSKRSECNVLDDMVWGFRPSWAGKHWINARADRLFSAPTFRQAAGKRRCLVLASGWYEWQDVGGSRKQPYYLHLGHLFAFAGVWTARKLTDQDWELNFAIVTTAADCSVAGIHARMPVILHPRHLAAWVDPRTEDPAALLAASDELSIQVRPVSTLVNDPRNDVPACIEAVSVDADGRNRR